MLIGIWLSRNLPLASISLLGGDSMISVHDALKVLGHPQMPFAFPNGSITIVSADYACKTSLLSRFNIEKRESGKSPCKCFIP